MDNNAQKTPDKTDTGLSQAEAEKILKKVGPNIINQPRDIRFWEIAAEEITEPMILLLLSVGFFYALWGKPGDAITIFIVIIILVLAEVWNEYRAKKAIRSLARLAEPRTRVLRDGKIVAVESTAVVPGDILILAAGTRIAADGKLLLASSLEIDESSLTGESFPEEKRTDQKIRAGTLVISGEGKAEVSATGKNTEMGTISALAEEIKTPKTPLQLAMKDLAKNLVWFAVFFSAAIPLLGYLAGRDPRQMVLTALALAFAFIPEEMPIIITIVLGLGAYQMSRRNFLVKKIKAAEILGSATVILSDKTGTITENKMRVESLFPADRSQDIMVSALNALSGVSLANPSDPTDQAIIEKAREIGAPHPDSEIVRERLFGNGEKTKAILRCDSGHLEIFASGAPEEILDAASGEKTEVEKWLKEEAGRGKRVIAIAKKIIPASDQNLPFKNLEKDLTFVGLISLADPPRPGVAETVTAARHAGIRIIMVTGDHPATASFIAQSVGIPSTLHLTGRELDNLSDEDLSQKIKNVSVFPRSSPEHKYRLVKALHRNNEIVAVTGDGVNDALALKAADIGIAMGIKGTDVAREAADAVLADDNFITLGQAIFEGRKFFDNLKKGVKYYLSVKMALILIFLVPLALNFPFPFAPIQIIILELFMDLAASAGFVSEPAEKTVYSRPPLRREQKFLDAGMLKGIAASAISLALAVTISFLYALTRHVSLAEAQTFAFTAWLTGHILLAFISRSEDEPLSSLGFLSNKVMVAWALVVFSFLAVAMEIPVLSLYLKIAPLNPRQLAFIFAACILSIGWLEIKKILFFKKAPKR